MQAYRVLLHHASKREATELTAELASDDRAQEFARERLAAQRDCVAIEVWRGPVKLCHLRSGLRRAA